MLPMGHKGNDFSYRATAQDSEKSVEFTSHHPGFAEDLSSKWQEKITKEISTIKDMCQVKKEEVRKKCFRVSGSRVSFKEWNKSLIKQRGKPRVISGLPRKTPIFLKI